MGARMRVIFLAMAVALPASWVAAQSSGTASQSEPETSSPGTAVSAPLASLQPETCAPTLYWANALGFGGETALFRWRVGDAVPEMLLPCGQVGGLALNSDAGTMTWTDTLFDGVRRANLDGTDPLDLLIYEDIFTNPRGIVVDSPAGVMYWNEYASIVRANLDASARETIISDTAGNSTLVLDRAHGKLYWSSFPGIQFPSIQRSNLDGTGIEILVTGAEPSGLALDLEGGKMYWPDRGNTSVPASIRRASLDGSGMEILVDGLEPFTVAGIALDLVAGKIYWGGFSSNNRIRRANLDGSNVEDLVDNVGILGAFALQEAPDQDQDRICDAADSCPASDPSETIVLNGCDTGVVNRLLPGGCNLGDRYAACAAAGSNRGAYSGCVAKLTNDLMKQDLISSVEAGLIWRCVAIPHRVQGSSPGLLRD
jgi:hypothetical protein